MLFSMFVARHARGELDTLAESIMQEVAEAVLLTGKTGSMTVDVKMAKSGGRVMVDMQIKHKKPMPSLEEALYFVGRKGLQKEDPLQQAFESMRGLGDEGPATLKRVVDDDGVVSYEPDDEGVQAPTGDDD